MKPPVIDAVRTGRSRARRSPHIWAHPDCKVTPTGFGEGKGCSHLSGLCPASVRALDAHGRDGTFAHLAWNILSASGAAAVKQVWKVPEWPVSIGSKNGSKSPI